MELRFTLPMATSLISLPKTHAISVMTNRVEVLKIEVVSLSKSQRRSLMLLARKRLAFDSRLRVPSRRIRYRNSRTLFLAFALSDLRTSTSWSRESLELATTMGHTSPIFLARGFKPDSARKSVDKVYKDSNVVIVFGRYFISNPNLVFKIKNGIELTRYDRLTFYAT
ncbi:hypothetical protein D6D03_10769 [Aureobasidium pullulans]|nr:hypothetical protein D6D03_10769 [Aureobasidium pullulans]